MTLLCEMRRPNLTGLRVYDFSSLYFWKVIPLLKKKSVPPRKDRICTVPPLLILSFHSVLPKKRWIVLKYIICHIKKMNSFEQKFVPPSKMRRTPSGESFAAAPVQLDIRKWNCKIATSGCTRKSHVYFFVLYKGGTELSSGHATESPSLSHQSRPILGNEIVKEQPPAARGRVVLFIFCLIREGLNFLPTRPRHEQSFAALHHSPARYYERKL